MAAHGARNALPPDVAQTLRRAFAGEVAARLPHLRDAADLELARLDVHTLASSAVVVGEQDLGVLARQVEDQLAQGDVTGDLQSLVVALEGFAP
ncbi:MAG TPA: Hpt domain-containing protein [Mycobacteriales bacterium]|nr:Hpt domain-containing protein [Mycobacteriales bacterium]